MTYYSDMVTFIEAPLFSNIPGHILKAIKEEMEHV